MKMMKRMAALLLALVLAVGLAACGKDSGDVSGKVTPVTEEATVPAGTVQQTEAPETEATEAAQETNPVSLGRMEGGIYTNDYVGIACQLDANWAFYSAEELQELPAQTNELFKDTEYADAFLTQITDMMAENVNDMTTINVLYQKLGMQERLIYAAMNDDAVVDSVLTQSESMAQAYAQAGFENAVLEKVTVNFLGEERIAIRTSASVQGVPYYVLQLFEYDLGQYSVTITFSSFVEDKTESMLDLFYAVE